MARAFTNAQRALLRAPAVRIRLLATFYLDAGTYRFTDDVLDVVAGGQTYIGASALTESIEVRSGADLAAEPITLICDGNRMEQHGIQDPARVLSDIMGYLHQQRRVDFAYGLSYPEETVVNLMIPIAAMKINHVRLVDQQLDLLAEEPVAARLEIVCDSLAMRYGRSTYRTRSHADQQEIDSSDMFFSFTQDAAQAEKTIYWGKKAPRGGGGLGMPIPGGVFGTFIRAALSQAGPSSSGGGTSSGAGVMTPIGYFPNGTQTNVSSDIRSGGGASGPGTRLREY
jgi:hypothetical protein